MTAAGMFEEVTIRTAVPYAAHDGETLTGTLYSPKGDGPFPAIVALHGGGWRIATPTVYQYLGPWLAQRGYVVFAPVYRLATPGKKSYPEAVHDVRAAVQFVKGNAADLHVAAERVALMGESAGGHLASLVALAGDEPALMESAPDGAFRRLSTRVKAAITVYGVHDLVAQWRHDLPVRLGDQQLVPLFLGTSPAQDRRLCFEASPISHAVEKNNGAAFLVAWGTADDIVDCRTQSEPFVEALKQAKFYVRTVGVTGAPHYWLGDPLTEEGSYSGFLAPRLLRFLQTKL